jgi:hypothetical protein
MFMNVRVVITVAMAKLKRDFGPYDNMLITMYTFLTFSMCAGLSHQILVHLGGEAQRKETTWKTEA